ncbi:MAG: cysteine desulfurase-like protein, partial [Acidimicrobiia bacterium]
DWENCGLEDPSHELAMPVFDFGYRDKARGAALVGAYREAGGPGRLRSRADFSMVIAQFSHFVEAAAVEWLDPASIEADRAHAIARFEMHLERPLTIAVIDEILDSLASWAVEVDGCYTDIMSLTTSLDVEAVRARFPALNRLEGTRQAAYLDGPGGTQVSQQVIDAMSAVLRDGISNSGGGFTTSDYADLITAEARRAMADMFNADPNEISFGQNMTSITFAVSRALATTWAPGDAVVVTSLDHDANYTPWVRATADAGAEVRIAEFDPVTGELDPSAVGRLLDDRVRLVAVCVASNAIGTVVDVGTIAAMAHESGALVYLDAVHACPHRLLDVKAFDCDFLVASSYKFFGPHTGILYGRLDRLEGLDAYKVRPAPSDPPGKLETGTQSFESMAGVTATVEYLAGLAGDTAGSRREHLVQAYSLINDHERSLSERFLDGVASFPGVKVYGVPTADRRRVATFAIGVEGHRSEVVAAHMARAGIYVWSGHYYAVNAMDRLGVLDEGGLVRVGFVHYNTAAEVDRVLEALADL